MIIFCNNREMWIKPLVPDSSALEFVIANSKLQSFKFLGSDQIPAELVQAGGEILRSKIHVLINSIWNTEKIARSVDGVYYCTS
jgi:hypothetical protein